MDWDKLVDKKNKLDQQRPLAVELVKNLEDWFRVELTYTSNAIEGNTLTRQETALVVEKGLTVGGKTLQEHLEATNHAKAFDWLIGFIKNEDAEVTQKQILEIHKIILHGIDEQNAGFYRSVPVRISGSRVILPNPLKVPKLMEEFSDWLSSTRMTIVKRAALAHYKLVSIHPFIDGNGRTARLLMNLILMQKGYPPAIIRKRDRLTYIKSLEEAQLGGSLEKYYKVIYAAIDRSLDIYLDAVSGKIAKAEPKQELLKIGQVAKQTKESVSTIRHWTQMGLIAATNTTDSGYLLYALETLETIRKIKALKQQRLSLQEIKEELNN
ncbi:MAG: Fic family protein [Deltaproteobacteria bacterium]|nr:Fic family protein [Deltaproteobacteria bacterium]